MDLYDTVDENTQLSQLNDEVIVAEGSELSAKSDNIGDKDGKERENSDGCNDESMIRRITIISI